MPETSALNPEQLEEFERRGVVRLEGLLPLQAVGPAREVVLRQLAKVGLWQDGGWRLDAVPRPQWPDHGLKTSKVIGNRHEALAALVADPALCAAVSSLLGGRAYAARGSYTRPMVLFTLPNAEAWSLPDGWHTDSPRLASNQSAGVQLFTFLEPVEPRGGGTVVIAGSHRLMNEGRHIRPRDLAARLRSEAFFRDMASAGPFIGEDPASLPSGAVNGEPLQVMEITGAPGDAWLVDLRVLHAGAPNAKDRPRVMLTHRFERADLLSEVAEAWGWTAGVSTTGI
ncbi:MAG TPA: phytanoyl-CoA dioxygenase family protein [Caulobacteraceae bacterium]|nr:phytanoyl-CoA dioxygenase family protein [Caulobacteraceae bacterium]